MILRTMVATATLLMAATTSAFAQTDQNAQGIRDILNRAQTQSDRKAVEDLIGKLGGGTAPSRPAPPSPAGAGQTAPAPASESQASAPAATPAQPVAPQASAPAPGREATPQPPATAAAPVPAPSEAAGTAIGTAASGVASSPPSASTAASAPAATVGSEPQSREPRTPASPPVAAAAPAPVPPPPQPQATSAKTQPVGAPIGPAKAFPTPIGPTETDMARAPDVAREKGLPTVDIEVLFGYDSADITPATAESLMSLGRALVDPRLAGQKFVIAGHTDAKGAKSYNLALSERRAQAVRGFLVEQFKIAPENLVARGFGESRLKNPRAPLGAENRRVQIINWTGQTVQQQRQ